MLVWLSVWSEMQTCVWPSWCHCHSLSFASVKSRLVLPFWFWLTRVVPEKGPLNGCVCVCMSMVFAAGGYDNAWLPAWGLATQDWTTSWRCVPSTLVHTWQQTTDVLWGPYGTQFYSSAALDPRVGHTMDIHSPFISVLCHSDWLFHGESSPHLDVVHPVVFLACVHLALFLALSLVSLWCDCMLVC